jgi:hypothetical protein
MATLTKYEQETIYNYNQEEKTASCYTHDAALIRRLDRLVENGEAITIDKQGDGWREYTFPKSWIKVRPPRKLSDEQRREMANRMKFMRKDSEEHGMAE